MMNEERMEQLNQHYSERNTILAQMSKSDRAALDYVKGLSGFKKAYPEFAADYEAAKEEMETIEQETAELRTEWITRIGEWLAAGETIAHEGANYEVIQGHIAQLGWEPDATPALFKRLADPGDEWPEFVHPTGAHDAYHKGDKVTFEGEHYISLIDNNSWSPSEYPAGWEIVP